MVVGWEWDDVVDAVGMLWWYCGWLGLKARASM